MDAIKETYSDLDTAPNSFHAAIMSLWDDPELTDCVERKYFSTYIHNLQMRLKCAYLVRIKGFANVGMNKTIDQEIGMLPMKSFQKLIDEAIALPKEDCADYYPTF